jgi:hypothetical protein
MVLTHHGADGTDIGMTLELLSPLSGLLLCAGVRRVCYNPTSTDIGPHALKWGLIWANNTQELCKAIVGVAGGATRAAITMHQARADNMAGTSSRPSPSLTDI